MTDQSERESFWKRPDKASRPEPSTKPGFGGPWGWWALASVVVLVASLWNGDRTPSWLVSFGGAAVIYLVIYLVRGAYLLIRRLSRRHD
jgi:hypothetical protein